MKELSESTHSAKRLLLGIKIVVALIPLVLLLSIINRRTLLFSRAVVSYTPGHRYNFISFNPNQLVKTTNLKPYEWVLQNNDTVIHAWLPRTSPTVRFQASISTPDASFISVSATGTNIFDNYSKIVWSSWLNTLTWPRIRQDNQVLWQRPSTTAHPVTQYSSIDDVRRSGINQARIGVAGVDSYTSVTLPKYTPSTTPLVLPAVLGGSHEIYLYAADEDIHLEFDKVDRNIRPGADPLNIRVFAAKDYDGTNWIFQKNVADDGNSGKNSVTGSAQHVLIDIPHVPAGMYRLQLNGDADMFIQNFSSMQHVLGFNNTLHLTNGPAYKKELSNSDFLPVNLVTQATQVLFSANHQDGLQKFTIHDTRISLKKVGTQVVVPLKGATTFTISKPDLTISAPNALVTLAPFTLPPIHARTISLVNKAELDGIDYIISSYVPKENSTSISIDETYPQEHLSVNAKKQLTFTINAPGVEERNTVVSVDSVTVTYNRGPFPWSKIWSKARHLISK